MRSSSAHVPAARPFGDFGHYQREYLWDQWSTRNARRLCRTVAREVDSRRGNYLLRIGVSGRAPRRGGRNHGRLFAPPAPPAGTLERMSHVTRLLDAAAAGDRKAAAEFLPL